ncbi:MAG TPA: YiiD C-terminal domain-containing protein [Chthoniobacteraceae bacterium]|nr:YiiD C-terminal domain-containing protein [Chthoniobacteraceae bacterium]
MTSLPQTPAEIENYLYEKIPLTRWMEIRVGFGPAGELVLSAPEGVNHNHLGTIFGGSLCALATVAGYTFLWLKLGDGDAHVVIQEGHAVYRRPVAGEFRARVREPEAAEWKKFHHQYLRRGKGRLTLSVEVSGENSAAGMEFRGLFVASL